MLSASIGLDDREIGLDIQANSLSFGTNRISKFNTHFLSMSAGTEDGQVWCWVGEREDPFSSTAIHLRHEINREIQDYQGILVTFRAEPGGTIEVSRTEAVGCPIYLAAVNRTLVISWRFEEVATALEKRIPDKSACKRFLEFGPKPTRNQIFQNMHMLWPGEKCVFDSDGLSFEEAAGRDVVQSGVLRDDARATEAFLELLCDALRPLLERADSPMIELSGGLDSACVALAAVRIGMPLNSFAAIQQGAIGKQQVNRRNELVELLGLKDATGPSDVVTPFAALQLDECSLTPLDDIFRMSCINAFDAHPAENIDLVITGIGGDELTMENTIGREDWEVRSTISSSANDAAAGRADMYMRRGIWLSQPLTSKSVVDFCRALPKRLRNQRMLNLLTLARAGLSEGFLFPRFGEHFGVMTLHEASTMDFDLVFSESVLADYGLCDLGKLLSEAREATIYGFDLKLVTRLWFAMKLESVLRRYC